MNQISIDRRCPMARTTATLLLNSSGKQLEMFQLGAVAARRQRQPGTSQLPRLASVAGMTVVSIFSEPRFSHTKTITKRMQTPRPIKIRSVAFTFSSHQSDVLEPERACARHSGPRARQCAREAVYRFLLFFDRQTDHRLWLWGSPDC